MKDFAVPHRSRFQCFHRVSVSRRTKDRLRIYALYNLKSANFTINACVGQIKPLVNNSNKAIFVELVHIWDLYIRLNKPIDECKL